MTSESSCFRKLFWGILICLATFYSIFTIVDHFEVSQQSLRWNQQRLQNFSGTTKNRRACSQKLSFNQNFKWCKSGRVSTPSIRSGNFRNTLRTIQNLVIKIASPADNLFRKLYLDFLRKLLRQSGEF